MVISQRPKRVAPRQIDAEIYKWRHLIENFFGKLKEFKRIALRACKTDASFAAMIYAAAASSPRGESQQSLGPIDIHLSQIIIAARCAKLAKWTVRRS